MTTTLADLVTPETQPEVLALSLSIAAALGLPTTAWQPIQAIPTVMATNAQIAADYSSTVAFIAQGGYPSYAATMVDGKGNSVTSWMDLIAKQIYNVTRQPSTAATGVVPVSNVSATSQPWSTTNPLRFQNAVTGATYTTTGTGSILAGGVTNVAVAADAAFVGVVGTSGAGVTLAMLTPLAGCTPLPLVTSLIGSGQETNAALLLRGQAKIASISPNGPAQAYDFIAKSIPQGTPSAVAPYAIGSVITRSTTHASPNTGVVQTIVANAAGPPNGTDLNVANQAIQNQVVPSGVQATVSAATTVNLTLTFTAIIQSNATLTAAQAITNIEDELANLLAEFPIGGYNANVAGFNNYIPYDRIVATIMGANVGTVDLALNAFTGAGGSNGQILVTDVPVLVPPTAAVVFI